MFLSIDLLEFLLSAFSRANLLQPELFQLPANAAQTKALLFDLQQRLFKRKFCTQLGSTVRGPDLLPSAAVAFSCS